MGVDRGLTPQLLQPFQTVPSRSVASADRLTRKSRLVATVGRLGRFATTGLISLVLDASIYVLLHYAGTPNGISAASGYLLAVAAHYILSRRWVFHTQNTSSTGNAARYLTLVLANMVLTGASVELLVGGGVDWRVARACVAACVAILNYPILRLWIFKTSRSPVPMPRQTPVQVPHP